MNISNFSFSKDVILRHCGIVLILGGQYLWIAKIRPDYGDTISKVESLVHFTLSTTRIIVTNSLRRKFVRKDDCPNPQTSITLEQVSIRKVLTSLEPWIPALCVHQNFMKQINDLSISTEVIDKE